VEAFPYNRSGFKCSEGAATSLLDGCFGQGRAGQPCQVLRFFLPPLLHAKPRHSVFSRLVLFVEQPGYHPALGWL
jgi:hypothetical protein